MPDKYAMVLMNLYHILVVGCIVLINLGISYYIRVSGISYIPNTTPIGFTFGYFSSILILIIVAWVIHEFELNQKYALASIMILGGLFSNFSEKYLLGAVADYMTIGIGTINLADILIFLGVLLLNLQIWWPQNPILSELIDPREALS
jgi:lipoprotein signal peptidase